MYNRKHVFGEPIDIAQTPSAGLAARNISGRTLTLSSCLPWNMIKQPSTLISTQATSGPSRLQLYNYYLYLLGLLLSLLGFLSITYDITSSVKQLPSKTRTLAGTEYIITIASVWFKSTIVGGNSKVNRVIIVIKIIRLWWEPFHVLF